MKFFHSIFFKLFMSFLIISVVPLSFVGWITYTKYSNNLYEKLEYHANYILSQKMKALHTLLTDLERMKTSITQNNTFSEFIENNDVANQPPYYLKLDILMDSIQSIRPETTGITIISNNGLVYNYGYSLNMEYTSERFTELQWFKNSEQTDSLTPNITNLHTRDYSNLEKNQKVYSYVQKVWDRKLKASGYIMIDFKMDLIKYILSNEVDSTNSSGTFIYDDKGFVLPPNKSVKFSFDIVNKQASGSTIQAADGKSYLIFKKHNPETKWYVVEFFETNEFYEPVLEGKLIALIVTLTSIFVCLLSSLFISHRISRPIKGLQRVMQGVESGNLDQTFITNSKDELGDLARGFNQMIIKIKQLIQSVAQEERLKKEAEITALQLQINPHFIYNTLETINSLARKKKEHDISHLIVLLGRLLRLSISSFEEKIPIKQEITYIESYLEIQNTRMREPLDYHIVIESEIRECSTVKWILQPIVENAIVHGIDPLRSSGRIDVEGQTKGDLIVFTIKDNGVGIDSDDLEQIRYRLKNKSENLTKYKKKIGLYNVQTRIHSHYGNSFGIMIDSKTHEGTTVTITIPREEYNHDA